MRGRRSVFARIFSVISLLFVPGLGAAADFYWENPVPVVQEDARFPVTVKSGAGTYLLWQEIDGEAQEIWLSLRYYVSNTEFSEQARFAGPFVYSGEVPDIYSAAVQEQGRLAVAVVSAQKEISVFTSDDHGQNFSLAQLETESTVTAPRIFTTANGSFRLFASLTRNNSFCIITASSPDGVRWQNFRDFAPSASLQNPFVPSLVPSGKNDVVVFQAHYTSPVNGRLSYQLYSTVSKNNGASWTDALLVTDENSLTNRDKKAFYSYQNQGPSLLSHDGKLYLVWEQTENASASVRLSALTPEGRVAGENTRLSEAGNASRPHLFEFDRSLYVVWFDTRRGKESVYLSKQSGLYWEESTLCENNFSNLFPSPLLFEGDNVRGNLSFIWQQGAEKSQLCILTADYTVSPPRLVPLSYRPGAHSQQKNVQIQVDLPEDSSGISGYSYLWTQDSAAVSPEERNMLPQERRLSLRAEEEGLWYLSARVMDYAGNWSNPVSLEYNRDLTPPGVVAIESPPADGYGLLQSNTFRMSWLPPEDDDVAGYTYQLLYVGALPARLQHTDVHPLALSQEDVVAEVDSLQKKYAGKDKKLSERIVTPDLSSVEFQNRPNGVYIFSVAAIDTAGNMGEPASQFLILNKFVPRTYISAADQKEVRPGESVLELEGGGFTYDGRITRICIDRDGIAPYDLELFLDKNEFRLASDSKIQDIRLNSTLDEGKYRICLYHSSRGMYVSDEILEIQQNGTVKIESNYVYKPKLRSIERNAVRGMVVSLAVAALLLLLICILAVFIIVGIVRYQQEKILAASEVQALLSKNYDYNGTDKPGKKRRLPSLKNKLSLFTAILIFLLVALLTLQSATRTARIQKQALASGLQRQIDILNESLSSGIKNFMPANNILELTSLPAQKEAMAEIKYITILGRRADDDESSLNYVWASNDPDIAQKISTPNLIYGESEITDGKSREITSLFDSLNDTAAASVGVISDMIGNLAQQAASSDEQELERLSQEERELRSQINERLNELSKRNSGSIPHFDSQNLDYGNTDYIFYKPVLYRRGTSGQYVHAVILIELSSQNLIDEVMAQIRGVIILALTIAAVAMVAGAFSAYILAYLIVKPIKKLESYLDVITETADKEKLAGSQIELKSRDEIGRLGTAVNAMVDGLVKASQEEKLLLDGKAVQQAFIPLLGRGGLGKQTIAKIDDGNLSCFGYYEGASGVSGDYFDFLRLDANWTAFVKCDASGHGVPAAIIMTVVATLFRSHFASWSYRRDGISIDQLVIKINDFIESLGLAGKFATMIVCLLNTRTGECHMCNAGDNLVRVYDGSAKKLNTIQLSKTPVAGSFSSSMIAPKNLFRSEKLTLKKNDVLFLYTDGIEEAKRYSRYSDFEIISSPDPRAPEITINKAEELGNDRIRQVIEAVFSRTTFILEKTDNPVPGESLEFDFTGCEGTIGEAIIALVSVEKVFRMYKPPFAKKTDYIQVDKRIDEFLQAHFNLYDTYCQNKVEISENSNYVNYEYVQEDVQEDDLTLVAIKFA